MTERILVAVAWPYASGPRHLGHVAGFAVPSDIFARYHRLKGDDVLMVSGTDDHGTPITLAADQEGISPRAVSDRYNRLIAEDLQALGMSYDLFTRTATHNHHRVVQELFRTLYERGYLVKKTTLGAVSAATGRTLPDRYIEGTCPICGFGDARGDQCDNCGNQLDPTDLIDPRSKIDGTAPVFKDTEHFFLDLPAFADQIRSWIDAQGHWRPNVRKFSLNLLDELRPRAITRDLDWGVHIPLPEYEHRDDKRIYVWFDAVIGYLSASIEWSQQRGAPEAWRDWWHNPECRHFYFMGKDNIVFHTVIWPSILLGAGQGDLQLPHDVVASEYLTYEGEQFSVSRDVGIYVRDFLARYDPDALRYFLTAAGPETQDTDFTWREFVRRNNGELVSTWGNLVNRTLTNVYRNFGEVPEAGELTDADRAVIAEVERGFDSVGDLIAGARFKRAVAEAMRLAQSVNVYLSDQAPWKLMEPDRARAATILHVALRCVDNLKVVMAPFLPFSSERLHQMMGYDSTLSPMPRLETANEDGDRHDVLIGDYADARGWWRPTELPAGQRLREPAPLFTKLDDPA